MKSPNLMRTLPLVALLVAAMSAFAPGCGGDPDNGSGNPGGTGGAGAGGSGGVGGDQTTTCTQDNDCPQTEECIDGLCEPKTTCTNDDECEGSRICVEGLCEKPCLTDSQCGFENPTICDTEEGSPTWGRCIEGVGCNSANNCQGRVDYCEDGGCICVTVENPPENRTGVCRRRTPTCSPCNSNEDCGNNTVVFDDPADCIEYNFDGEMISSCLPQRRGACPLGTVMPSAEQIAENPALEGHCIPASGDCADFSPCANDDDCMDNPAAPICDRSRGICVPACHFDVDDGTSQFCPPGQVCHVNPDRINPALLAECSTAAFFGQGKCDPPCNADVDCSAYDGGTGTFGCFEEKSGERRCRPKAADFPEVPSCLDDRECPDAGDERYLGFCDFKTDPMQNTCVYDTCRAGEDPRAGCGSGIEFEDCSVDFKCVEDISTPGFGVCEEKDCLDWGGADGGCVAGQFCAGEPMIDQMSLEPTGSPLPPPTGVLPGECYNMDVGAWCQPCNDHSECTDGPTDSERMGLCINGLCNWGCDYDAQCPGRWNCSSNGLQVQCGWNNNAPAEGLQICENDTDCGTGNRCVNPIIRGSEFKGFHDETFPAFKVCECSATEQCTGDYVCNAGIATAGVNPEDPDTYGVRSARYCVADTGVCGPNGSCEWFDATAPVDPMDPKSPRFALLFCAGTNPEYPFPGGGASESYACPDGTHTGLNRGNQTQCVFSSVCMPFLVTPPGGGDPVCGVQSTD